jgi:hypothetical protein
MYTYIYIVNGVCVGYIPAGIPTRARDRNGRIVGARNRTHVCIAGGAATCTPIPISHTRICIYICIIYNEYIYITSDIHTSNPSFVRAAIPTHVGTRACACPHVSAHTRERASAAPPNTTARAASTTRRVRPAAVARRRAGQHASTTIRALAVCGSLYLHTRRSLCGPRGCTFNYVRVQILASNDQPVLARYSQFYLQ